MSGFDVPEGPVQRVSSGSPGLDTLLRGGWFRGGTYIVTGVPGAGKTLLGNQFCFAAVARGEHAVYVTVLAETHSRMMTHLAPFRFFRPEAVGRALHFVSGYAPLKAEGLPGLSHLLFHAVREHHARALVVDGLAAIEESAGSSLAFREFLHGLSVHNGLADCTTVLLSSHPGVPAEPHLSLVDGVVVLTPEPHGLATVRSLEVTKLRGAGQLSGKHTYAISEAGLSVYPRTEALHTSLSTVVPDLRRRMAFGVPGLDAMLDGGLVAHASSLLLGPPGCGKTLLGLHFLSAGARERQPGLFFGFSESPQRLIQAAARVGLDLAPHVDAGLLRLEARAAVETLPDALAQELLELVERHDIQRLVVDGVEPFTQELVDPSRTTRFFTAVTHALRERHVTVVWTEQSPSLLGLELSAARPAVGSIVDNVLFLRYVEAHSRLHRILSVLKMRESENDPSLRLLSISSQGLHVAETFESTEPRPPGGALPLGPWKKPARRLLPRRRRP